MRRRGYAPAIGLVAQWLEQGTHNPLVVGSNPAGPTLRVGWFDHLKWALIRIRGSRTNPKSPRQLVRRTVRLSIVSRASLLVFLGFLLLGNHVRGANDAPLLGSALKTNAAAEEAEAILSGKVLQAERVSYSAPGVAGCVGKVEVLEILRGRVNVQFGIGFLLNSNLHEGMPVTGRRYLIFLKKDSHGFSTPFTAIKFLPPTVSNVATVKELIALRADK
jgi:hypothetical protein